MIWNRTFGEYYIPPFFVVDLRACVWLAWLGALHTKRRELSVPCLGLAYYTTQAYLQPFPSNEVNDDAGEDDGSDGDDNGDINNNSFSIARKKENFCHNASLEHTLTPGRKDPVWSILIKQSMTAVDI